MWRIIKIILLLICCPLIILPLILAIYHYIMLKIKSNKIRPVGTAVEVDGHNMNVYVEGKKSDG